MSTLKVDTISNNGTETDTPQGFTIAGNPIVQGYTESASEPSAEPNEGDIWWDTTNSVVKRYINGVWRTITTGGGSSSSTFWGGDRAVYAGGYGGSLRRNDISYLNMTTTNNTADFGDLTAGRNALTAASSGTRVLFMGGATGSTVLSDGNNAVDYITTATTGDSTDFGNLDTYTYGGNGCGNTTRSLYFLGYSYAVSTTINNIQYFTPDTPGNATDFGDVSGGRGRYGAACNSSTRALTGGADATGVFPQNRIEYVTIDTTGNSTTFGNLIANLQEPNSTSDETRGLWMGGYEGSSNTNRIQYITMDTTGNATDFGDLTNNEYNRGSDQATSNNVRALVFGTGTNGITNQYFVIQTLGNATNLSEITETNHLNGTAGSGSAS